MFPGFIEYDSIISVFKADPVFIQFGQLREPFLNDLDCFLFVSETRCASKEEWPTILVRPINPTAVFLSPLRGYTGSYSYWTLLLAPVPEEDGG